MLDKKAEAGSVKTCQVGANTAFTAKDMEEIDVWPLPRVEQTSVEPNQVKQVEKTNAIGKKPQWRYEPPEETVVDEVIALTAHEIDEIRQAAQKEGFSEGKEEGFTKGYEEGLAKGTIEGNEKGIEQGREEGLEQGKETIESLSKSWEVLTKQLHDPLANIDKNIEEQLLNLVVSLTEAVVLEEAKTNPDILMTAISEGIKSLPSNDIQTQIHLHPDDIKMIEKQFGETHISESGWRLLPAPQLDRGGCQIENSTSTIDLQMKSKLKKVLSSFLQEALHHGG